MKRFVIMLAILALFMAPAALAGEGPGLPPIPGGPKKGPETPPPPPPQFQTLEIKTAPAAPTLDGKVSEEEYKDQAKVEFDMPNEEKATVYFTRHGAWLYVGANVEGALIQHQDFTLKSFLFLEWKKDKDALKLTFKPYSTEPAFQTEKNKKKTDSVSWLAEADFSTYGHWQVEFKVPLEALSVKADETELGSFAVGVNTIDPEKCTQQKLVFQTARYPEKDFREAALADKFDGSAAPQEEIDAVKENIKAQKEFEARFDVMIADLNSQQFDNLTSVAAKALELDPDCFPARLVKGVMHSLVENDYQKAAEELALALESNPTQDQVRQAIFNLYTGPVYDLDKAEALLKKDMEYNPDNTFKKYKYAAFIGQRRYDFLKAAALCDEYYDGENESLVLLYDKGRYLFWANQFDNATEVYKKLKQKAVDENKSNLLGEVEVFLNYFETYKKAWPEELKKRNEEAAYEEAKQLPRVKIVTSKGDIILELFEDDAPNTVANFITLVEQDFYNGTTFHRVIEGFMAQGGSPTSRDDDPANDGMGGPGYSIKTQTSSRKHFRGVISMANSGPNTDGSQFFITTVHTPHLDGKHAVFGRVIEGQDVVDSLIVGDELKSATVLRKRDHEYKVEKMK